MAAVAPAESKRLLVVSAVFPFPVNNGRTMRTSAVLRSLAESGYEVDLLAFAEPGEAPGAGEAALPGCRRVKLVPHDMRPHSRASGYLARLLALPSSVPFTVTRFRSAAMRDAVAGWLATGHFDAVVCDAPYILVNIPQSLAVPLVLNQHNVEHVLFEQYAQCDANPARRAYARHEAGKLRRWEREACRRAGLVFACSEPDAAVLRSLCPGARVVVAPNTVDVETYSGGDAEVPGTVLYTGGMDWYPNQDAVRFLAARILPELRKQVPEARVVVAGRSPSPAYRRSLAGSGIEFTGTVPDMRTELAKAAVCIVPLRIGSGTRLKILEAAAMGKPVVSTRLGAEGLAFRDGAEIILADEPQAFAAAVARLLGDRAGRHAIGQAARRRVDQAYNFGATREAIAGGMALVLGGRADEHAEPWAVAAASDRAGKARDAGGGER